MEEHFRAPWDNWVRTTTSLSALLLFGIPAVVWLTVGRAHGDAWLLWLLPPIVLLGALPFAVTGYRLCHDELWIDRPGRTTRVSLDGLKRVEAIPGVMAWSLRTLGNGGLFAFCGYFRNRALGPYQAFVTDGSRTVVLSFDRRTVVVSPEPVNHFVTSLKRSRRLS